MDEYATLEGALCEAAADAADAIGREVRGLWPKWCAQQEAKDKRWLPVLECYESVVAFEILKRLAGKLPVGWFPAWEASYAKTWTSGKADLAFFPAHSDAEERAYGSGCLVELKWMSRSVDWLASDVLKLAWGHAERRYVLGIGSRDPTELVDQIEARVKGQPFGGWTRRPKSRHEFHAARKAFLDIDVARAKRLKKSGWVGLFRARYRRVLD